MKKQPSIEEVKEYFKDAETILSGHGRKFKSIYEFKYSKSNSGIYADNGAYEVWYPERGYAKILTYKKPKFIPIAMRCNQEQFDLVKGKLEENNIAFEMMTDFLCNSVKYYLINDFNDKLGVITNVSNLIRSKRQQYETWNEKVFLEACGIVVEEPKEETFVITKKGVHDIYYLKNLEDKNDLIKALFPSAFVEDKKELVLEVGKWYKLNTNMCNWFMNYQGDSNNCYGLNSSNNWSNGYIMNPTNNWIKATPEEVEEALKNEAVKRGFKEGVYFKTPVNGFQGVCNNRFEYVLGSNILFCGGRSIFNKGQWATIIQTITIQEAEQKLNNEFKIV